MHISEWVKKVDLQYHAFFESLGDQAGDPEARAELFAPIRDWYEKLKAADWKSKKDRSKHGSVIARIAKPITDIVRIP